MYTLTYESKSTGNPTDRDMEELLTLARAKNYLEGITGCLIYYMGIFIQVIEGDKFNVLRLFNTIKKDKRHRGVHLFSDDEIDERNFPDWAMGYCSIDRNLPGTKEFDHFKKNLSLFADLSASKNITAKLFWRRVKFLISSPPEGF
ncbi:BLUF domain-containing protein [Pricia sp.]|uniref:BLUF domain-containing protein n=1 Tax=Pricia sp. TaxID=2268138 RepID=UPI003594889E